LPVQSAFRYGGQLPDCTRRLAAVSSFRRVCCGCRCSRGGADNYHADGPLPGYMPVAARACV